VAAWVTGTYTAPSGTLPLKIELHGGTALIGQEIRIGDITGQVPTFDLELGSGHPYVLTIETGASECTLDLGGLPLTKLEARQGAGSITFDFSAPNPAVMATLGLYNGAGSVQIRRLGNANVADMVVEGGAASYTLDFGGALRRDATVKLTVAMASIDMTVPSATAATLTETTVMGSAELGDGFMKKGDLFMNQAAVAGKTPVLSIHATATMGSVSLREG
jgi:hypothetical protein